MSRKQTHMQRQGEWMTATPSTTKTPISDQDRKQENYVNDPRKANANNSKFNSWTKEMCPI